MANCRRALLVLQRLSAGIEKMSIVPRRGLEERHTNLCELIRLTTNCCLELDLETLHFASTFLAFHCTAVQEWVGESSWRKKLS